MRHASLYRSNNVDDPCFSSEKYGWRVPIKIGTCNVRSLYKAGSVREVATMMSRCGLEVLALQEIRWPGSGECNIDDMVVVNSGDERLHRLGVGFMMTKRGRRTMVNFEAHS
jgi:hypothetical protein